MLRCYLALVAGIPIWQLQIGGAIEALDHVLDMVQWAIDEGAADATETAAAHRLSSTR
jgi:hypothetical protein